MLIKNIALYLLSLAIIFLITQAAFANIETIERDEEYNLIDNVRMILDEVKEKQAPINKDINNSNNQQLSDYPKAKIRILDKVKAYIIEQELEIGNPINIGRLTIKLNKCSYIEMKNKTESKALIEVFEQQKDYNHKIFFGWLLSSDPNISSIEHQIYDFALITCLAR